MIDSPLADGAIGSTVAFGAINLGSSPSPPASFISLLQPLRPPPPNVIIVLTHVDRQVFRGGPTGKNSGG
jgi:hypothetical protein